MLIDAGTGVGDLTLAELSQIDHIFITHSHLDHVASIPFLVDTVGGMRTKPLTVYATAPTIEILQQPPVQLGDLARISPRSRRPEAPFLRYQEIELGDAVDARRAQDHAASGAPHGAGGRATTSTAARRAWCSPATPGRTTRCGSIVNRIANLKFLIIETAFSNKERQLAEISRHLCPTMLAEELAKLERNAEIYITHLKPGEIEPTMLEIEECAGAYRPRMLQNNLVLEF